MHEHTCVYVYMHEHTCVYLYMHEHTRVFHMYPVNINSAYNKQSIQYLTIPGTAFRFSFVHQSFTHTFPTCPAIYTYVVHVTLSTWYFL